MPRLGKRYVCASCGQAVVCIGGGDGELRCCDAPMAEQAPKNLPSSD
jgi:hypothetical protein